MQGAEWTYEQLLDFHQDSMALLDQLRPRAALHDEYGKSEEQDAAILADMHIACVATFASWFADVHQKYPEQLCLQQQLGAE